MFQHQRGWHLVVIGTMVLCTAIVSCKSDPQVNSGCPIGYSNKKNTFYGCWHQYELVCPNPFEGRANISIPYADFELATCNLIKWPVPIPLRWTCKLHEKRRRVGRSSLHVEYRFKQTMMMSCRIGHTCLSHQYSLEGANRPVSDQCVRVKNLYQLSQAQSIRYFMTFHTGTASWNTASNVCRANNGRLVTLENTLKINMAEYFKSYLWARLNYSSYWVGLSDNTVPEGHYKWSDCTPLDNTTANWHEGEPDNVNQEYCVRALKEWGSWETVKCDLQLPFICEERTGYCRTAIKKNYTIWTSPHVSSYKAVSHHNVSFEECKDKCWYISSLAKSCWAAVYIGVTKTCTLLIDSDPVAILRSKLTSSPGNSVLLRECFQSKRNTNTVETGLEDMERIPHGCFGSDGLHSTNTESSSATTILPSILEIGKLLNTKFIFDALGSRSSGVSPFHSGEVSSQAGGAQIRTTLLPTTETYIALTSNTEFANYLLQSSLSAPSSVMPNQSPLTANERLTDMISCCPCRDKTVELEESLAFISRIVKSLEVQTNTTSSYKRKHISVDDDRLVSRGLGYLGAVVLAVIFGGLVLFDISTLARDSRLMLSRFDNKKCHRFNDRDFPKQC